MAPRTIRRPAEDAIQYRGARNAGAVIAFCRPDADSFARLQGNRLLLTTAAGEVQVPVDAWIVREANTTFTVMTPTERAEATVVADGHYERGGPGEIDLSAEELEVRRR